MNKDHMAECANPECDHDRTIPSPGCALRKGRTDRSFPVAVAELRAAAEEIRAELVCCDVFARLHIKRPIDRSIEDRREYRSHSICYWGEASARLVDARADALISPARGLAVADHKADCDVTRMGGVAGEVARFNVAAQVGAPVLFWPGAKEGEGREGVTRSRAWLLGDHTPVVMVEGYPGAIALTHVAPIPPQPHDPRTHGGNHAPLPDGARLASGFCDDCDQHLGTPVKSSDGSAA